MYYNVYRKEVVRFQCDGKRMVFFLDFAWKCLVFHKISASVN